MTSIKTSQLCVGGIEATIERKAKLKNFYIRVLPPDGRVVVSCPAYMQDEQIGQLVTARLSSIVKHKTKIMQCERQTARHYVSGETHYVWGKAYKLRVTHEPGKAQVYKQGIHLILNVPEDVDEAKRESVLTEWYRAELKRVIPDMMERLTSLMGLSISTWGVKKMKTRWGTCNTADRRIWLNLNLAKKPLPCLEYVIVHELCHLLERNHTARFYALVEQYLPQWRETHRLLNELPLDHFEDIDE